MSLIDVSAAAHLGGTAILALFFVLLARHDPRPYLRDWTFAWLAQLLSLGLAVTPRLGAAVAGRSASLFLEALHGLLLCSAAHRYSRGTSPRRASALVLVVPVALASVWAPLATRDVGRLLALQHALLALTYAVSAVVLWPLRPTSAMGLRLVTTVLVLLSLVFVLLTIAFGGALPSGAHTERAAAPLVVLCLQLLLGLGMVLAFMETSQRELSAANTRLEEVQHKLKMLAETDPLTGCFNRRIFREFVDVVRADKGARGVVLLMDMDGLKKLNDAQGHSAGDQAIRRTAEAIRSHTRDSDRLIRWGGDEFVLVLPGAGEAEAASRLEQIQSAIAATSLSASAGLVAYGPEKDIVLAIREADHAMYRAKAARKAAEGTPALKSS